MTKEGILKLLKEKWPDCEYFAEGGNSWVYKATISNKINAVKVFRRFDDNPKYMRFIKEIAIMQSLSGTFGIVHVNPIEQNPPLKSIPKDKIKSLDDIAYFTMDFYNASLKDKIKDYSLDNGLMAVNAILEIAKIIKGLHDKNYVHRDLKPDNVLIDKNNNFLVSDYGLSIDLTSIPEEEYRLTNKGEQIGSLSYRAPELLRGRLDDSDHKPCDVFSLGRMLWALIHGKEPHGVTDFEFQESSVNTCGRDIRNPTMLDDIIKSSTSVDPKFRTRIEDFIESLESWRTEKEKGSYEEAMRRILNNPSTNDVSAFWKKHKSLVQIHYDTINYLSQNFNELVSDWKKMSIDFKKEKGYGSELSVNITNNYYPDFSPEVLVYERFKDGREPRGLEARFMLDINVAPRIHLAIYIYFDAQNWEGQKFLVFGGYIPKGSDITQANSKYSIKVTDSQTHHFDYRETGIKTKMLIELTKGFKLLNEKLYHSII